MMFDFKFYHTAIDLNNRLLTQVTKILRTTYCTVRVAMIQELICGPLVHWTCHRQKVGYMSGSRPTVWRSVYDPPRQTVNRKKRSDTGQINGIDIDEKTFTSYLFKNARLVNH